MITTLDGHTIEIKPGSYSGPEGLVKQHAGVKLWLLIDGDQWYSHDFRNSHILGRYVTVAAELTLAEWIEYCGDEIEPWVYVPTPDVKIDGVTPIPGDHIFFSQLFDPI